MTERCFVIVGNRELRTIPARILAIIKRMDGVNLIGLRHPVHGEPQPFELTIAQVCRLYGLRVRWFEPELGTGREGVYYRDIEMATNADCVLAFFSGEEMRGGTEHVVEKAIDAHIPVYAYGVISGKWTLIGCHDQEDVWSVFSI